MDLIFSDCHLLCNVYLCIECREQKRKKMFINMCALSVWAQKFWRYVCSEKVCTPLLILSHYTISLRDRNRRIVVE